MMPTVATPRIPRPMITAATMRMILRALLPPVGVCAGAAGVTPGAAALAATGADASEATGDPHLLQNFVPAFSVAPQELQNAINHLVRACWEKSTARVYRRLGDK